MSWIINFFISKNIFYCFRVEGIEDNAAGLLVAADKYDIPQLKALCEEALIDGLDAENCLDMLIMADMFRLKNLKGSALQFISSRTGNVFIQVENVIHVSLVFGGTIVYYTVQRCYTNTDIFI